MAKQNLNVAVNALDDDSPLVFRIWRRPFQLDPTLEKTATPTPGATIRSVAKRDRLWLEEGGDARASFGVATRVYATRDRPSLGDMASLKERGAERGVAFSFDGAVTNTRDSLRLVLWAQSLGRNEQLMTALGWRHFGADMEMADRRVLLDACAEAGLSRTAARSILDGDAYGSEVDASHGSWSALRRVSGIPVVVFRCYFPHVDYAPSPELRFDGSVAVSAYGDALAKLERLAREAPRWTFAKAAPRYAVVHAPACAVREKPSTASPVLRWYRPGAEVDVHGAVDGWLKLKKEAGWMLLESPTYGTLLRPAAPPPRKGGVLRISDL